MTCMPTTRQGYLAAVGRFLWEVRIEPRTVLLAASTGGATPSLLLLPPPPDPLPPMPWLPWWPDRLQQLPEEEQHMMERCGYPFADGSVCTGFYDPEADPPVPCTFPDDPLAQELQEVALGLVDLELPVLTPVPA